MWNFPVRMTIKPNLEGIAELISAKETAEMPQKPVEDLSANDVFLHSHPDLEQVWEQAQDDYYLDLLDTAMNKLPEDIRDQTQNHSTADILAIQTRSQELSNLHNSTKICKFSILYGANLTTENLAKLKSHIMPLGNLEKNESKHDDMIAILEEYQKYVPHGIKIPLEGDGLSNMRGVESQDARADGATAADRLEGIQLVTIEWHARVAALQDVYNAYYDPKSAREKDTLFQLSNRFDRRIVTKSTNDSFNPNREFLNFVSSGYLILAVMETPVSIPVHAGPRGETPVSVPVHTGPRGRDSCQRPCPCRPARRDSCQRPCPYRPARRDSCQRPCPYRPARKRFLSASLSMQAREERLLSASLSIQAREERLLSASLSIQAREERLLSASLSIQARGESLSASLSIQAREERFMQRDSELMMQQLSDDSLKILSSKDDMMRMIIDSWDSIDIGISATNSTATHSTSSANEHSARPDPGLSRLAKMRELDIISPISQLAAPLTSFTYRELLGTCLVSESFIHLLSHKRVLHRPDNQDVVRILSGDSRVPHLKHNAVTIYSLCTNHYIHLSAEWIRRDENDKADYLSKTHDDYKLNPTVFDSSPLDGGTHTHKPRTHSRPPGNVS
uniref:DUF6589 domain-containing protein n=1 Tax=Branchiostoma floridae TaxID=7739 RepID=C3Z175_BRAFL|eukprot:XP_002597762.1 hypothetical protein BRAFLDRAFT_77335 [Branchiostoma floridae]